MIKNRIYVNDIHSSCDNYYKEHKNLEEKNKYESKIEPNVTIIGSIENINKGAINIVKDILIQSYIKKVIQKEEEHNAQQ